MTEMFKKLKYKLMLVNMIIISALLLGSFGVIYFITQHNVNKATIDSLRVAMQFERRADDQGRNRKIQQTPPDKNDVPMQDAGTGDARPDNGAPPDKNNAPVQNSGTGDTRPDNGAPPDKNDAPMQDAGTDDRQMT
jgi:hypothetical protein